MKILAHRGWWKTKEEQNTLEALMRAVEAGYGIETDIRDLSGELVICHDMPKGGELSLSQFLKFYKESQKEVFLALNIKSDGLSGALGAMLKEYQVTEYAFFDMSVPDTRHYHRDELSYLLRRSEWEKDDYSPLYEKARGVWLDELDAPWVQESDFENLLSQGKEVHWVSPDLHKREHRPAWERFLPKLKSFGGQVSVCTDYPDQLEDFLKSN